MDIFIVVQSEASMKQTVLHEHDIGGMACCAAEIVLASAREAMESRGVFTMALSGGSTPLALYSLLAEPPYSESMPWGCTHLFWGDERCVPPDHPESNYRTANEALISRIIIPVGNVHRMWGELASPDETALVCERDMDGFFRACDAYYSGLPEFDLILLGMGRDGHTASLFPGRPELDERRRLAVPAEAPSGSPVRSRVTLTFPVINNAARVVFLVTGDDKRPIVESILARDENSIVYPASRVQPRGELVWITGYGV